MYDVLTTYVRRNLHILCDFGYFACRLQQKREARAGCVVRKREESKLAEQDE